VSRIRHVGFWTIRQIKKKEILRQKIGSKKEILRQKIGSKKEDPSTNLVDIKKGILSKKILQTLIKNKL